MFRCGIVYHPHKTGIQQKAQRLEEVCAKLGIQILFSVSTESDLSAREDTPEALIVLGGDGSVLRTLPYALKWNIPVFGVNFGTFGFLTRFEYGQVIDNPLGILQDHLLSPRNLLDIQVESQTSSSEVHHYALNDGVIHRQLDQRIAHYWIEIDHHPLGEIVSDGLVVSTSTGSTAYALSVGGSILCPSSDSFQLVPISPHTLCSRPIVLSGKSALTIRTSNHAPMNLSIDGRPHLEVKKAVFSMSPKTFLLAYPPSDSYWTTLSQKVLWGKRG